MTNKRYKWVVELIVKIIGFIFIHGAIYMHCGSGLKIISIEFWMLTLGVIIFSIAERDKND